MSATTTSSAKISSSRPGDWAALKAKGTVKENAKIIQIKDIIAPYYNLLVLNVRENKWDKFSENLGVMEKGNIAFTATDLTKIIDVCGSYEKSMKCVSLVNKAIISVSHFTQILRYCDSPTKAEKVYDSALSSGYCPDADFVSKLLIVFRKSTNTLNKGEALVRELREKYKIVCTPSLYANLYQLFKHCKGEQSKLDIYDSWVAADKASGNGVLVKQQISACAWTVAGQKRAEGYFHTLNEPPKVGVLNALINVYASSRNGLENVSNIILNMRANKIVPTEVTYTYWLQALGNSTQNRSIEASVTSYFTEYGLVSKSYVSPPSKKIVDKRGVSASSQKYENLENRRKGSIDAYAARNFMVKLDRCKTSGEAIELLKAKLHSDDYEIIDAGHFSKVMKKASTYDQAAGVYLLMRRYEIIPDTVVYDVLIRKAIGERKIAEAEKLAHFYYDLPEEARDKEATFLCPLIEYHGIENDDVEKAEKLFARDHAPSRFAVTSLLKVYKKAKDLTKAENFFSEMRSIGLCDVYSYTTLFDVCAICAGGMKKLYKYERWMSDDKVEIDYTTVGCKIRCCTIDKEGFDKAEQLFSSLPEESRKIQTYNALLNLYAEAPNKWRKALNLFQQTKKDERTVETYNIMIKAASNNGLKEEVIETYLKQMHPSLRDSSTVTALVRTCIPSGNYKKADEYLRLLNGETLPFLTIMSLISVCRSAAKKRDCSSQELTVIKNLASKYYKAAVDQGLGGNCHLTLNYLELVPEDPLLLRQIKGAPTTSVYDVLIKNCRSLSEAMRLKREMETKGLQLSETTYSTLINKCAIYGGDIVQADKLYKELLSRGVVANEVIVGALIKVCVNAGGAIQKALSYFKVFVDNGGTPNVILFNTLIDVCAAAGDLSMADKVLAMMREHKVAADITTYNTLINVCAADNGNRDRAITEFDNIRYPFHPGVDTFTSLINVVISEGKSFDDAKMYYKMMTQTPVKPGASNYIVPDAAAITSMIVACIVFNRPDTEVTSCWEQFTTYGVAIDAIAYGALIRYYAEQGNYPEAKKKFIEGVSKFPRSYELFHSLIKGAVSSKQKEGEILWIRSLMKEQNLSPTLTTYNRLILYHSTFGTKKRMKRLISEMKADGFNPNLSTYHIRLLKTNSLQEVNSILQEMEDCDLETNFHINSCIRKRVNQLNMPSIFSGKAAYRSLDGVELEFIKQMRAEGLDSIAEWTFFDITPSPKVEVWNEFLELYALKPRQFAKVEKIFSKISKPDEKTFKLLFIACSNSNCSRSTVEKYIELMKSIVPIEKAVSMIVPCYNDCIRQSQSVEEVEAIRNAMALNKIDPNEETYLQLFVHCVKNGGDITQANQLFKEMLYKKIRPTREVFNALIEVCIKSGGAIQRALSYCKKMIQLKIVPDQAICHRLLHLCLVAGGDCKSAETVLKLMHTHKVPITSDTQEILHSIVEAYKETNNQLSREASKALKLDFSAPKIITDQIEEKESVELSEKQVVQQNSLSHQVILTSTLEAIWSKEGSIAGKLKRELERFKDANNSASAAIASCKIRYFGFRNEYVEAKNCFKQAIAKHPSSYELIHSLIIAATYSKEKSSEIDAVLGKMASCKLRPNLTTFNLLLAYYFSQRDTKGVESVFKQIKQYGFNPNLTTYYIQFLAAKSMLEVDKLLTTMSDMGLSLNYSLEIALKKKIFEDMQDEGGVDPHFEDECLTNTIQRYLDEQWIVLAETLFVFSQEVATIPLVADQLMEMYFKRGGRQKFVQFALLSRSKVDYVSILPTDNHAFFTIEHKEDRKKYILALLLKYKKSHTSYSINDKNPNVSAKWYIENLKRFKSDRMVTICDNHFTC